MFPEKITEMSLQNAVVVRNGVELAEIHGDIHEILETADMFGFPFAPDELNEIDTRLRELNEYLSEGTDPSIHSSDNYDHWEIQFQILV